MNELRTLVIDDDTDFCDLIRMRLESWGHSVTVVHNWLSAMMVAGREDFDVMLVDVETPTGNGLTACKDLADNPKIAATPKVFVTGLSDDDTIRQCRELNAQYLYKSSTVFDDLQRILADVEPSIVSS